MTLGKSLQDRRGHSTWALEREALPPPGRVLPRRQSPRTGLLAAGLLGPQRPSFALPIGGATCQLHPCSLITPRCAHQLRVLALTQALRSISSSPVGGGDVRVSGQTCQHDLGCPAAKQRQPQQGGGGGHSAWQGLRHILPVPSLPCTGADMERQDTTRPTVRLLLGEALATTPVQATHQGSQCQMGPNPHRLAHTGSR